MGYQGKTCSDASRRSWWYVAKNPSLALRSADNSDVVMNGQELQRTILLNVLNDQIMVARKAEYSATEAALCLADS